MSLNKYSTAELQAEIDRREAEAKEKAKDHSTRTYFKKLNLKTIKEKAEWLNKNPEAVIKEKDGEVFYEVEETFEEKRIRLTRTADAYEAYDQAICDYYEDGKHVGYTTHVLLGDAQSYADVWENDTDVWKDMISGERFATKNRWFPWDFNPKNGYTGHK